MTHLIKLNTVAENLAKSKLLKTAISLLLLVYLLHKINVSEFTRQIAHAQSGYIVIGGLLFFVGIYVSSLRWKKVLQAQGISESVRSVFVLYLMGAFFNNFLPSSVGGDGYKYFRLAKKYSNKKNAVISSMFYERGVGFLALILANCVLIIPFINLIRVHKPLLLIEAGIVVGLLMIVALVVFRSRLSSVLSNPNKSFFLIDKLRGFMTALTDILDKKILTYCLSMSFLFILNIVVGQVLYLKAFGVSLDTFYILFVITVVNIVGIVPISLNSIGLSEGIIVFLYGLAGVSPETALAVALVGRVCGVAASSVGGLLYVAENHRPINVTDTD